MNLGLSEILDYVSLERKTFGNVYYTHIDRMAILDEQSRFLEGRLSFE